MEIQILDSTAFFLILNGVLYFYFYFKRPVFLSLLTRWDGCEGRLCISYHTLERDIIDSSDVLLNNFFVFLFYF